MSITLNLYFKKFVFLDKSQIQTTVRRGVKWAEKEGDLFLRPSEIPEDGYYITPAKIVETEVYRFCNIPIDVLRTEHDPACHSYEGLLETMEEAYEDFEAEDFCTVIWFRLT